MNELLAAHARVRNMQDRHAKGVKLLTELTGRATEVRRQLEALQQSIHAEQQLIAYLEKSSETR